MCHARGEVTTALQKRTYATGEEERADAVVMGKARTAPVLSFFVFVVQGALVVHCHLRTGPFFAKWCLMIHFGYCSYQYTCGGGHEETRIKQVAMHK